MTTKYETNNNIMQNSIKQPITNSRSTGLFDTVSNIIDSLHNDSDTIKANVSILNNDNLCVKIECVKIKDRLDNLEKEHIELKKENSELKKEIVILKDRISKMERKDIVRKILMGVQDLNRDEQLEQNNNFPFKTEMTQLRDDRINECHYIKLGEKSEIVEYKKYYLLQYLQNTPTDIIDNIDSMYCDTFINAVINHLNTSQFNFSNLSNADKKKAEFWWNN